MEQKKIEDSILKQAGETFSKELLPYFGICSKAASSDFRRFRTYEAIMSMKTDKTVITHVLYSGNVKSPVSEFRDGLNVYKMDV